MSQKRVCLIGAGPSGMSILYHFYRLKEEGKEIPEVICFEKQESWGGLWNYTWRTGLDEHGDPVHGSMYRNLWTNAPKEGFEYPDYTFDQHFGKPISSFPPREVLFDYLKGRWQKNDLTPCIRLNHIVMDVQYNKSTDNFTVVVKNRSEKKRLPPEIFDYVIVATGHFSTPCVPYFPGIEDFPGRVVHSHDFRDAHEFKGQRILIVGGSFSAEDIALQVVKYDAKSVVCSWRSVPMDLKFPPEITEHPLLQKIENQTCHFKDGFTTEVDTIILCTGYQHSFKFLEDDLHLRTLNVLYPTNLYKGIVYLNGGNNKCLYIGMQNQFYTLTMFDAQAHWIVKYLVGEITLPDKQTMHKDVENWIARCPQPHTKIQGFVDFQTAYILDLTKESGYGHDLDTSHIFYAFLDHRAEDVKTCRDQVFTSKYTGTPSIVYHTPWMKALDDSKDTFLSVTK